MSTNRIKYLIAVAGLLAALGALAAVTLTSGAEPDPVAAEQRGAKQQVAIASKGVENASGSGEFVLTPLEAGPVAPDSGTVSADWHERVVMRAGQRVAIDRGVETFEGKQGALRVQFRIEWVDAGNEYYVGTGTWKVVGGTGEYALVAGGGRSGNVWRDRGSRPWSGRADGFLTLTLPTEDGTAEKTPSHEQKIQQTIDTWAPLYAAGQREAACKLMADPACVRITCEVAGGPNEPLHRVKRCTPPSAAFRKSFADATVEEIAIKGKRATAEFSNGERVEFFWVNGYAVGGVWWIRRVGGRNG